ncbi:MAG TPA: DUF2079 domain-containing protein [Ktedonobacteraceae bacterium]|nr:DUF2079 domain-containing protein [Ktedonobacteraceae bacterium]
MASKQDSLVGALPVPQTGSPTTTFVARMLRNVVVPLAGTRPWVAWATLLLATLVYAVVMSHQAVLRYDTFKATAFDLGNMDQVLWNTIHGRPFQFTNQAIDWYGPPTRLAIHFEPIILLLSLLYIFHADPRILLVFQTLALVSGALPVFLLARKYLPEWPLLSACMAIAYLLSPALIGMNIFDFHPVSLATPLLLYAVLALTYKRHVWFLIACVLAAACKEEVPLSIALLGVLVIWRYKSPCLGITLISGGLLWSFLAFFVIIPYFFPGAQHNNFWYRYESLGSSPGAAILNLLLHPWLLLSMYITFDRFFYLAGLLRSSGFLALLALEWLLPALPSVAINILSTDPTLYSGVYHYNAIIIPFIMLAAIHGTRRLITVWQGWRGEVGYLPPRLVSRFIVGQTTDTIPHTHEVKRLANEAVLIFSVLTAWRRAIQRLGKALRGMARRCVLAVCLASEPVGATLEIALSIVLVQWRRVAAELAYTMAPLASRISVMRLQQVVIAWIICMVAVNYVLAMPLLNSFWADHEPGSREQHIQQLLALIPADASVSAGSNLNPHLSERQRLAVFPSPLNTSVEYIIVDLNAVFPEDRAEMASELNQLMASGQFRELARAEGVVLLVRRSR